MRNLSLFLSLSASVLSVLITFDRFHFYSTRSVGYRGNFLNAIKLLVFRVHRRKIQCREFDKKKKKEIEIFTPSKSMTEIVRRSKFLLFPLSKIKMQSNGIIIDIFHTKNRYSSVALNSKNELFVSQSFWILWMHFSPFYNYFFIFIENLYPLGENLFWFSSIFNI